MRNSLMRKPSAALVVSVVALMVALGGTGYAAFGLPKNSVGTKQIKNNAVTGGKIQNGAVTASKLNVSGVTVPNASHATTADTASAASSATHATIADSANQLNGTQIVFGTQQDMAADSQGNQLVVCPTGMSAIDGGETNNGNQLVSLNEVLFGNSGAPNDSVRVYVNNDTAVTIHFTPYAVCIKGSVAGG